MLNINDFIIEKLKINSKSKISNQDYKYLPKTNAELFDLVEKRIKEEGDNIDFNDIDTSNIDDMEGIFAYKSKLTKIDISEWDVSNVTNMTGMFEGCKKINCDLSAWDVHNATNMERMFYNCESLNQNFDDWQINKDAEVQFMFGGCKSLKHKPDWYTTRINS